jgi:MoxR-like ATPase
MNRDEFKQKANQLALARFSDAGEVKSKDLVEFFSEQIERGEFPGRKDPWSAIATLDGFKVSRGTYSFSGTPSEVSLHVKEESNLAPEVLATDVYEEVGVIPEVDDLYVPFGFYANMKKIVKSNIFYPTFITGMSGNGKTKSIQQVCAELKRRFIRVNITAETDESDLIGGYKLKDGNTVFEYGPVIAGMKEGAVVLIDEIDLGSSKLMCLQSILEGAPYHIKKTGEYVHPAPGFTVIATANTKGKGSDDGRFIGTNILNEAFLERFVITVEQEYPTETVETKILTKLFNKYNIEDPEFIVKLVRWAKLMREAFNNGAVDEVITTRRLAHIAKSYAIFDNKLESIKYCLNRFDDETKAIFLDAYSKIDASVEPDGADWAETPSAPPIDHPF